MSKVTGTARHPNTWTGSWWGQISRVFRSVPGSGFGFRRVHWQRHVLDMPGERSGQIALAAVGPGDYGLFVEILMTS